MDYESYIKTERANYAEFAITIRSILEAAIRDQGDALHLQQIQSRSKEPASLWSKLLSRGITDTTTLETDVKDLAGCRIIFYTNDDVSNFERSGVLHRNFEVDWDRTKFHYPLPESTKPGEVFIGNNYVVRLKEDRSALPEYARFKELWCEVQVQTILNHAWSETAHELTYKPLDVEQFGSKLNSAIRNRLHLIMTDHLLPAGYEFQKALDDYRTLSKGKKLLDQGGVLALNKISNNNERYDFLRAFGEYLLPNYDDLSEIHDQVRARLIKAVEESRRDGQKPRETEWGNYPGASTEQVVEVVANILGYLRYLDVEKTFDAVCELFSGAASERERTKLLTVAEQLAEHNLQAWQEVGPRVQAILVRRIQDLSAEQARAARAVVLKVLSEVLDVEVQGTTARFDAVTFHRGEVSVSEELLHMRAQALELAKREFSAATTLSEKAEALSVLFVATHCVNLPEAHGDLLVCVMRSTLDVVKFCMSLARQESYEFRQEIESRCVRLFQRNIGMRARRAENEALLRICDAVDEVINTMRTTLDEDREYLIYKCLVGFDSVFPATWLEGMEGGERWRKNFLNEQLVAIDESVAEEWLLRIKRCAQAQRYDGADFMHFREFLEEIGRTRPKVCLAYLDRIDGDLERFLSSLLKGLSESALRNLAHSKIASWVQDGLHLREVAWYLRSGPEVDCDILRRIVSWGIERNDHILLIAAIAVSIAKFTDDPGNACKQIFEQAVRYLSEQKVGLWVQEAWYQKNAKSFFTSLAPSEIEPALASLLYVQEIDHCSEYVLVHLAEAHPEMVFDLMGARLEYAQSEQASKSYDAIPTDFYELDKPLSQIPDYAVNRAKSWFATDAHFRYHGGKLLYNIFKSYPENFEQKLLSLIESADREDIEFVVEVLLNFEGDESVWNTCRQMLRRLSTDDELLNKLEIVLEATGGTSGTFGLVAASQRKKEQLSAWLTDPEEKVRAFASRLLLGLDRKIAAEQRRAEESLEMRKRGFDSIARADDGF